MLNHRKSNQSSILCPNLQDFSLKLVSHLELDVLSVGGNTQHTQKLKKKKENPSFGYVNSLRLVGETTN